MFLTINNGREINRIMKKYDYLLVGGGLFSGVFAYRADENGNKCRVIV